MKKKHTKNENIEVMLGRYLALVTNLFYHKYGKFASSWKKGLISQQQWCKTKCDAVQAAHLLIPHLKKNSSLFVGLLYAYTCRYTFTCVYYRSCAKLTEEMVSLKHESEQHTFEHCGHCTFAMLLFLSFSPSPSLKDLNWSFIFSLVYHDIFPVTPSMYGWGNWRDYDSNYGRKGL